MQPSQQALILFICSFPLSLTTQLNRDDTRVSGASDKIKNKKTFLQTSTRRFVIISLEIIQVFFKWTVFFFCIVYNIIIYIRGN